MHTAEHDELLVPGAATSTPNLPASANTANSFDTQVSSDNALTDSDDALLGEFAVSDSGMFGVWTNIKNS